jgi:hypothetical protein
MIGLALTLLVAKVDEPMISADYRVCNNAYDLEYNYQNEIGTIGSWATVLDPNWNLPKKYEWERKFFTDHKNHYRIQVNPKAVGKTWDELLPTMILIKVFRNNGEYLANINVHGVEGGPQVEALLRSEKNPPP